MSGRKKYCKNINEQYCDIKSELTRMSSMHGKEMKNLMQQHIDFSEKKNTI